MEYIDFEKEIKRRFPEITETKLQRFKALEPLYKDWNSKINVISRKDIDLLYLHHVLHSLAIAEYFRMKFPREYEAMSGTGSDCGINFLDLGTGGGFPGIPLAIMFPAARFTLCDSIGKKIKVAAEIADAIGLDNVTAINARAENLEGKFDYVVSRAVTTLDKFLGWINGKYTKGILYLKGGDVVEEIAVAMGKFHLRKGSVHTWQIDSWINDPYFSGKIVIYIEA